jgi:hypothetical protein
MKQVIIVEKDGYVVSNRITDSVPSHQTNILIKRTLYRVSSQPITIVRSSPEENLLRDAAILVANACRQTDLEYQRKITIDSLTVREGNGALAIAPDEIVIVEATAHISADEFDAMEGLLQKRLS